MTSYELRTKFRMGGTGECIGLWGGLSKGYATNLVQGSYGCIGLRDTDSKWHTESL